MDIIERAEEEFRIFDRTSIDTSKALIAEVKALREQIARLKNLEKAIKDFKEWPEWKKKVRLTQDSPGE